MPETKSALATSAINTEVVARDVNPDSVNSTISTTATPVIIKTNATETQVNEAKPDVDITTKKAANPVSFDPSYEGSGESNGVELTTTTSAVMTTTSTTTQYTKKAPKEQRSHGNTNNSDSLYRQQEPAVSSMNKNIGWAIGVTLGVIFITG